MRTIGMLMCLLLAAVAIFVGSPGDAGPYIAEFWVIWALSGREG
jgi:hypothetical protein